MTKQQTKIEQQVAALLAEMTLQEKVALLSGKDAWHTVPIERLNIASVTMADGPHGVRATQPEAGRMVSPATSFPTGISMGASWDPELIERVGAALAQETRALGCDILLGPCVNIVRTPLAGRNFETYAEDPYLAGQIGVGWVNGLQGEGVGASLKHYACNNQEVERFRGNSIVDERTLREIYLPAFETVVKEARPWTVMCAYNRINGDYASEHNHLLNEILKDEWGFKGVVVSDWGANHTITASVAGGLDLEMPGPAKYYGDLLVEATLLWQIDEAQIDEAARRVLRLIAWAGKLDAADETPDIAAGSLNTEEHQALARELAEASITLLKNEDDLLPLDAGQLQNVAVIGPNAAEARIGGGGSSYLEPPYRVSPLQGLEEALGDEVTLHYAEGCDNYAVLPRIPSAYLTPTQGPEDQEQGLWGEYFANTTWAGEPVIARHEIRAEFGWYNSSPAENISKDAFSARWTAELTVPADGQYTFRLENSDLCRVYLDGELLMENEGGPGALDTIPKAETTTRELTGGQPHPLKIEFMREQPSRFARVELKMARTYPPGQDPRLDAAVAAAKASDVAIIFGGMPRGYESEGHDRPDLGMPGPQAELIRAVAAANPNTVVVLNCGAPVEMPWIDAVPAVLLAYYPGMEGGRALADILTGQVNPSGKLPVTFPKRLADNPTYINYPGAREVRYGEGIFVGYRYYDKKQIEPLFPFGFGLSYTTFEYGDIQAPDEVAGDASIEVSIAVENTGERAGHEVVQLYARDVEARVARPIKELKGFRKIYLAPGEAQTVTFTLDARALSFYDPYEEAWVAEPGDFELLIGSSSRDIRAVKRFTLR
ncbi:MAG: glycoside hydrolase family 3 C-terminal domain-containing protein [Anaerolineales bacterium]